MYNVRRGVCKGILSFLEILFIGGLVAENIRISINSI
jgi:hypothetical protein